MNTHKIQLNKYLAKNAGDPLRLGTAGSHGNEYLQVTPGEGWKGLTIQVIFHPSQVACMLPSDGLLEVPWEATADALTVPQGRIVFQGFDADRLVNSTDLIYTVSEHSSTTGRDEEPYTPGIVEGVLNQMEADKADILDAAQKAALAKEAAERSETAAQSCQQEAAKSADRAETAAELSKISTEAAQSSVESAAASASAADISAAAAANSAANASETLAQVQDAGRQAQQNVKDAETEALEKISAMSTLPTVSADAARQSLTVAPDGTGYTLTAMAPLASAIRPTVNGNPVLCADSIAWSFQDLKVYGKSTQNGVPSPENPVPIVSAGENGEIALTMTGPNIFDISKVDTEVLMGYNVSNIKLIDSVLSFDVKQDSDTCYLGDLLYGNSMTAYPGMMQLSAAIFPNQPYTISIFSDGLTSNYVQVLNSNNKATPPAGWDNLYMNFSKSCTFTSPENASKVIFRLGPPQTGVVAGERFEAKIMICPVEKATDYKPFLQQSIPLSTPNGLPGVPAKNKGTYTDADGQHWVCDIKDYAAGKYIQNCMTLVFDGNPEVAWYMETAASGQKYFRHAVSNIASPDFSAILCDRFNYQKDGYNKPEGNYTISFIGDTKSIAIRYDGLNSVEEWNAWLSQNPTTVVYPLADPMESDIPASEMAAYRSLQTRDGATVLSTAEPAAGIEACYLADGTNYAEKVRSIEKRLAVLESMQANA